MSDIILISDPRVAAVPLQDSGEPLVDVTDTPRVVVDQRYADDAGAWRLVRSGVRDRLAAAAAVLPDGVDLLLVEGFRPPALQRRYFADYSAELAAADPSLDAVALHHLAARHISPPEVAPHSAGAAVDVTVARHGVELDLGTRMNATPEESDGRCYTDHPDVPADAAAWRRVLVEAMTGAGFVNYATEWWHFSFGDRYWALLTDAPAALYGPAVA